MVTKGVHMKKLFIILSLLFSITLTSVNAVEVSKEAKITGLYVAYFNRAADQEGLTYWTDKADEVAKQGGDVSSVFKKLSGGFATHPTFKTTYDHLNNKDFVSLVYQNALGRGGDSEGIDYWTKKLDNEGMIRSDMVSDFVELSLLTDLTDEKYSNLSNVELAAAQLRQDLITNKVNVSLSFTRQLGVLSNVVDSQDPEQDPAYLASKRILRGIDESDTNVVAVSSFLQAIPKDENTIYKILNTWYVNSCIINMIYKDNSPSDSYCIENLPDEQCKSLTSSDDDYDSNSFMKDGKCVSLGYPSESKFEYTDLTDVLRDWYYNIELYEKEDALDLEPSYIDWESNSTTVNAEVKLPENSPINMIDAKVEVVFNSYSPDTNGKLNIKVPKEQITDAYVMLQNPSNEEYVTYLISTILPNETSTELSAEGTAISLVLNGISHQYLTESGTAQEVKDAIRQSSIAFIENFKESLKDDPYWLRAENLKNIYKDPMFLQALSDSKETLKYMYDLNKVYYSVKPETSGSLKVLPQADISDFQILASRKYYYYYTYPYDMTGDIWIENDTMLPARYRATNLFTKIPIHTPKIGLFGDDLLPPQSGFMYGFNGSLTTVKSVNFQPTKITIYTPGFGYLPYDTPDYNYIKSMNKVLLERVVLDNLVAIFGSLVPVGNKQVYLKMIQWISKQGFFRTALDEYYANTNKKNGDMKIAIINILKGLQSWDNLLELMKIPAEYYSKKPLLWVAEKAKWVSKILSSEVGLWIYAGELASTELDLMLTPAYIDFTQISFPVFLKYYDPDSISKVTTTEESRRVTLTGDGLYPTGTTPTVKLEARDKDGKYQIFTLSGDKVHNAEGSIWFDLPYTWLNTGSDIVGPIYFQLISSFTDSKSTNLISDVKVPHTIRDDFYKINIGSVLSITGFSNSKVTRKEELTIYGKGFSQTNSDNTIRFTDHNDHSIEVNPTYSFGDYLETVVPEGLAHGPIWIEVELKDGSESNEKKISLIPQLVTASPESGTDFKDTITITLSQSEGLPIYYSLGDASNTLTYSNPITLNKITAIYAFSRVVVDGVNYDSNVVFGGFSYYKCAENEEFVDGECVKEEKDWETRNVDISINAGINDTQPWIKGSATVPMSITSAGEVKFDYTGVTTLQNMMIKTHIWGTGTWSDGRLILNGTYTRDTENTTENLADSSTGIDSYGNSCTKYVSEFFTFQIDTRGGWDEPKAITAGTKKLITYPYDDHGRCDPTKEPRITENNNLKPEIRLNNLDQLVD